MINLSFQLISNNTKYLKIINNDYYNVYQINIRLALLYNNSNISMESYEDNDFIDIDDNQRITVYEAEQENDIFFLNSQIETTIQRCLDDYERNNRHLDHHLNEHNIQKMSYQLNLIKQVVMNKYAELTQISQEVQKPIPTPNPAQRRKSFRQQQEGLVNSINKDLLEGIQADLAEFPILEDAEEDLTHFELDGVLYVSDGENIYSSGQATDMVIKNINTNLAANQKELDEEFEELKRGSMVVNKAMPGIKSKLESLEKFQLFVRRPEDK